MCSMIYADPVKYDKRERPTKWAVMSIGSSSYSVEEHAMIFGPEEALGIIEVGDQNYLSYRDACGDVIEGEDFFEIMNKIWLHYGYSTRH